MSSTPAEGRQRSSDTDAGEGEIRADRVMHPDGDDNRSDATGPTSEAPAETSPSSTPESTTATTADGRPADDAAASVDDAPGGYDTATPERPSAASAPADDTAVPSAGTADAPSEQTSSSDEQGFWRGSGDDTGATGTRRDGGGSDEPTTTLPQYDDDQPTTVAPAVVDDDSDRVSRDELYRRRPDEADRVAAARADHQAAATPSEVEAAPVAAAGEPTAGPRQRKLKPARTTDKFFGSLGLFVLRVVTGLIMGVHGVQKLLSMEGTAQFFGTLSFFGYPLPQPEILALATGAAELLMGVALVFGFLTRLCGFGTLLISVGALLMVQMTVLPNPFASAESGFGGELELLLAAVGLMLLVVGGGGWALDRLFRRGRYAKSDDQLD